MSLSTIDRTPFGSEPEDAAPAAPSHRRRRGRRAIVAAALALALVGGGVSVVLAQGGTPAHAAGLTAYADPAAGFAISYPAGWTPVPIPQGVLLQGSGQNAVSVKKVTLAQPVDAGDLDALRAVTDAVLSKPEARLSVLKSGATTIGGLTGTYYVYYFPSGDGQGAHTHYFLFDGPDMYTLVFQSLPASGFEALAPTFDAIAATFRVLEN